ncbi:MAG TPA: hypothetical protein VG387_00020 [Rhizomicrobium sp.]|jgi:hypothetical protein|nr:hypothetical protein [Rhizomicrobium sp.]
MKTPARIELFQNDAVVSLPLHLPRVLIPHLALIGFIVAAWTLDGVYALATSLV